MTVMLQGEQISRRGPVLPSRLANRETIRRLFQGYVNDFGPAAGATIIHVIVEEIGGLRITVPRHNHIRGGVDLNLEMLWRLRCRLAREFGEASAREIMRKFLFELKGMRLTFPDLEDITREERYRKIRSEFKGDYKETATRWGMSIPGVKKIVRGKE
jgi:Mor family transcriptional regulator